MNIDLLKVYEENKKIEEKEEKLNEQKELRLIVSVIINGEEFYCTDNEELIKKMKIKLVENKHYERNYFEPVFSICTKKYIIKLTKTNINKIQKYIKGDESNE